VQLSLGDGRRPQWFNIGPVGLFSIDQAREAHAQMKRDRALDRVSSRLDAIRAEPASEVITFQKAAMAYLDMQRGHDIGEAQYRDHLSRLKAFVFPSIGHLAIDRIKQSDIVRLLQPIWKGATTNGKAVKVRSLIERVLNTAKLPDGSQLPQPNVAAWSRLQGDLHKASAAVEHHAAMKYQDVPGFYQTLKADGSSASRAIMLLILTGCRLGEVIRTERSLGAQWDHIDYTANLWTIPAENHKTGRKTGEARVVTLTDEMKAVLGPHRAAPDGDLGFQSRKIYEGRAALCLVFETRKINGGASKRPIRSRVCRQMGPASALNPSELPRATGLEGRPWFPRVISLFSSVIFLLKKELNP
jgi:integrase